MPTLEWHEDPRVIAGYVLYITEARQGTYPPGGFANDLIKAAFRADPGNLARIGAGFPRIAEAVHLYRNTMNGREELIQRLGEEEQ